MFQLRKEGPSFGWKSIVEMWGRECTRAERGEMRKVPKLLPSYIERDAWTKLNVAPAKIMQVGTNHFSVPYRMVTVKPLHTLR